MIWIPCVSVFWESNQISMDTLLDEICEDDGFELFYCYDSTKMNVEVCL